MCFPILLFFVSRLWNSHASSSQFLASLSGGDLQLQALLSIKDQIAQDPFGILASWNNSIHFCNWTGVSCNLEQQTVFGLNLSGFEFGGRFSSVYKGILSSEQVVAVKVINLQERGAEKSFLTECEVLKSIRHKNIVKIITSCSSIESNRNEFKALIYEFMSNGDLDSWLHPDPTSNELEQPKKLNLIQRLNIAIDVASVLVYLHHSCDMPVIHHDIKPSNILLDDELRARVGDFGSARSLMLPIDETSVRTRSMTIRIIGTVGYVALEYGTGGRVTTLGDVYSFGILLLEMFTGKRPTDSMFKHNFSLRNYVKMAVPDHVMKIADPKLLANAENTPYSTTDENGRQNSHRLVNCLTSVFRIGVSCSAPVARERIQIKDAFVQLGAVRDAFVRVDERDDPPSEPGSSQVASTSGG